MVNGSLTFSIICPFALADCNLLILESIADAISHGERCDLTIRRLS
jgi:hypothetical protein